MQTKFPLSLTGYKKLKKDLDTLKSVERPKVIKDIIKARSYGDISENSEYHAAKEKQHLIELKISKLEDKIYRSEIIYDSKKNDIFIRYGSRVTLLDVHANKYLTYKIVGDYESDIPKGLISISSPLSQILIGKKVNDQFKFKTPSRIRFYKIIKVNSC